MENEYEADLVKRWGDLQTKVATICKLDLNTVIMGMRSAKGQDGLPPKDVFTFSAEQRSQVMKAMEAFIGHYSPDDPESPLRRYYGESYSLGLIQAAQLIGKDRPILDIIKNQEIYDELVKNGFDLVKNNTTKRIADQIITEMQAHAIAGSNPLSVAARLQKLFGDQNGNWRRLARTEMSMAAETAKLKEWDAWGVQRVEFVPAPDACPICLALKGEYPIEKCPIPGRSTHPHCRCSIRPAKSEAGVDHTPKDAPLAQRFEVNSVDDLGPLLQAFDRENPGLMVNGFRSIDQVSESYFMATIPPRGEFMISDQASYAAGGFNPAADLVRAMQNIRTGLPLSFNEEYSIESLWHEICHNRAKQYVPVPRSGQQRIVMEALNQLVARQTYPQFMEQLGGAAQHFDRIMAEGYGYGRMVRNLRTLFDRIDVDISTTIDELEKILFEKNYGRVPGNLASLLTKVSGKDKAVITAALAEIDSYGADGYRVILDRFFG